MGSDGSRRSIDGGGHANFGKVKIDQLCGDGIQETLRNLDELLTETTYRVCQNLIRSQSRRAD